MRDLEIKDKECKKIVKHCFNRFSELQKCLKDSEKYISDKKRIEYVINFCNEMKEEFK